MINTPNHEVTTLLSAQLKDKVQRLGSSYQDDFDWSAYDGLQQKYKTSLPRGGILFKTDFKLVNHHSSCSQCHYAFEIDTYGRGCVHDCAFCYAKDQLTSHGYWNRPQPFPVDLSEVRRIMYTVFETDKPNKWRSILASRIPLRIGSMSDSFMWMDRKYGVTRELLKILRHYRYPYIIFTRSDLVAHDEYIGVLDKRLASIQFSISGDNEQITKLIEPGAPSVQRRLRALEKLAKAGFWTTVRINPFFPIYPDGFYTDPEYISQRFKGREIPKLDYFSWDFLSQLSEAKVPSVLAGFVRLSTASINRMSGILKMDLKDFFRPEQFATSNGDKRYSDTEIAFYYSKLKEKAKASNLRFSTCYIGNGEKDYFNYQKLWTNKSDCCDAVGNVSAFKKTCQEIPWPARLKHSPTRSRLPSQNDIQPKSSEYGTEAHI